MPEVDLEADGWLVDKARAGNPEAFEVLVHRHRARVYRTALRILGNPADAEDVTQDVFIQLWTGLAGFAGRSGFSTWLYRVVVNRSLSQQRRRRPTEPLGADDPASAAGPEDAVMGRYRVDAVARVIAAMPADLRVVLVLHQSEKLSYHEIAAILALPDATVRGRLARARRLLLDELKAWS